MKKSVYYKRELLAELKMLVPNLAYTFTRKIKTIYIGCTDSNNLGDEAVFIALKRMLFKRCFLYKISYTKPSSGRYFRKLFFRKPDLILLGGGTLILKNKDEGFLKLASYYNKKYPKSKLAVLGTGVANSDLAKENGFPTDFIAWKSFLKDSVFTALRGENSIKILDYNITPNLDTHVFYDPGIYFSKKKVTKKKGEKTIGINFCNLENRLFGHNKLEVELFFKDLIKLLIDSNFRIHFYATALKDYYYMKEVLDSVDLSRKDMFFHEYEPNIEKSLKFFNKVDVFIGQRLHSVVFATATYTPFFAVEYESKTSDFLNSLGLYDKSIRTDSLDAKLVFDNIISIYNNLDIEQDLLFSKSQEAIRLQQECLDSFFSVL
ncbi:MAG: polysaccharide pyruvyl transferase family protein [Winogradskyella sp.]|uniref:polysaccharide pyruvyl transferase family protein n=1 Tax=Winogradskyella sp. TaxID=1883156 RepID=UPI000F3BA46C|nr:polysaccharide pyruvyl transferase family protein [Winogradskyella sp.]RNC86885.1 MAG: polysaccharide pyruvyl transferase family protein [Winogradskyella sp.]